MNRYIIYLLLVSLVFCSCNSNKSMLVGAWHVVKWENPANDSFFANAQNYIDTIGKGHDDATNIQLYGVANMDSMRNVLQKQYDSAKSVQMNAANKTIFNFKKDGVAEVTINDSLKTGKWLIDNENALILEEAGFGNPEAVSKYKIVSLTDKELVLRFYDESDSSTVTFEHEGK